MTNPVTTHSLPDDDRRDHSGVCFHPGDDRRFPASSIGGSHACFRPADDEPVASSGPRLCFRPTDDELVAIGGGHACFRPADEEPVAIGAGQGVSPCHHPSEPGDHTGRSDDLADGLHRALTELERQHLAALSSRS